MESNQIHKAVLTSLNEGYVELEYDWDEAGLPPISFKGRGRGAFRLKSPKRREYALKSCYYIDEKGRVVFVFDTSRSTDVHVDATGIYLAGSFNGWHDAVGDSQWLMRPRQLGGRRVLSVAVNPEKLEGCGEVLFKFVTEDNHWFAVDAAAPSVTVDSANNTNYRFDPLKTGKHLFSFRLSQPVDLSDENRLLYVGGEGGDQLIDLEPGDFFYQLSSEKELGAVVDGVTTTFRLFAPRAKWVELGLMGSLSEQGPIEWLPLKRGDDYVWELEFSENLSGRFYWYRLDGPGGATGLFDPSVNILDPYAKAVVSRIGPAIVVDDCCVTTPVSEFAVPNWENLVILEAHVRDLVKRTRFGPAEGKGAGFSHLSQFAKSRDFYPSRLGVNAIELQPIQENDSASADDYHWGYMTANFFSPASSYGSDPTSASQIEEFRELVGALHDRDLAVILDVVYNHVGEPAHLMYIDKLYYFHLSPEGQCMNWSGCGNDLRTESAMATRLIVDSLKRLVSFYGVDGFRFDLADLVGKKVLQIVERELKEIKPDIVLIAEPWSFKGHIGPELRDTGYASWNDGYREAIKKYVKGDYGQDGLIYFLKGSPEHYASWPAQTVNYVESHDDRVWVDNITENGNNDGSLPSMGDVRRTHMMIALLMTSVGIPMLHAGMDFLASKNGVNNTYLDGERNALDYRRKLSYPSTSEYFRRWIEFRLSEEGELLRHYTRPMESYFDFIKAEGSNALICVLNANGEKGDRRLMLAVNPSGYEFELPLGKWSHLDWIQWADHERFWGEEGSPLAEPCEESLFMPALSCGLWMV